MKNNKNNNTKNNKINKKNKKVEVVTLRTTTQQKNRLINLAKSKGMTITDTILEQCIGSSSNHVPNTFNNTSHKLETHNIFNEIQRKVKISGNTELFKEITKYHQTYIKELERNYTNE